MRRNGWFPALEQTDEQSHAVIDLSNAPHLGAALAHGAFHTQEEHAVQDEHGGNDGRIVQVLGHPIVQRQADDGAGHNGHQHVEPHVPHVLAAVAVHQAGHTGTAGVPVDAERPQFAPENHYHRKDGAELNDYIEHFLKSIRCGHMDEFIGQDQMAGAGNRQPFGDALDDAQQRREKIIQQNKSPLFRAHSVRGAGRAPPYSICVRHTSKTSPTGQWSDPYTSL